MGDSTGFGGEWLFAFILIAVIFGWGGGGFGSNNATNAAFATMADVNASINAQTNALNQQSILLSSSNNNYETARLISDQNMAMMNQNNANLINAIQGFNTTNQSMAAGFASVNQNLANLGYQLDKCCCDIKTTLLENRLQDAETKLNQQFTQISNAEQSAYLLNVMGKWIANAPATA